MTATVPDLLACLNLVIGHAHPEPAPWDEGMEQRMSQAADKALLDRHYGERS